MPGDASAVPAQQGLGCHDPAIPQARILEETVLLDADTRYAVVVLTSRQDTNRAFFAATIEVE